MKTPYILTLMALLIVLLVIFSLGRKTKVGKPSVDITSSSMKAVDFTVKDINGKELLLSNYRGKVVLLDVWATWCGYCVQEMPELVAMQRDALAKKTPLQIIGVSVDEDRSLVKPFVAEHRINYPVVFWYRSYAERFW